MRQLRPCPLSLVAALGILLTSVPAAAAPTLYGLGEFDSMLYGIDPSSGQATSITSVGRRPAGSGLAFLGGTLYAIDMLADDFSEQSFGTIDPSSGAFTRISDQDGSFNCMGLAADQVAGVFYTVDLDGSNAPLRRIEQDGTMTTIGSGTGIDARGLEFVQSAGLIYAAAWDLSDGVDLYSIDPSSGDATLIGATGLPGVISLGLAYDPVAEVMYLSAGGTIHDPVNALFTVDLQSGAATIVGSFGVKGTIIDGLAWGEPGPGGGGGNPAVPEPGTLGILAALGATAAAARARRSRVAPR